MKSKLCLCILIICQTLFHTKSFAADTANYYLQVAVRFNELTDRDTLSLQLFSRLFPALEDGNESQLKASRNKAGYFCFVIHNASQFGYFSIVRTSPDKAPYMESLVSTHLYEGGDSISIDIERKQSDERLYQPSDKYHYSYLGRGCYKYRVEDILDSTMTHSDVPPPDLIDSAFHPHDQWLPLKEKALYILSSYEHLLSPLLYNILAGDIRYANSLPFFIGIKDRLKVANTEADSFRNANINTHLYKLIWDWERPGDQWDTALYWSKNFAYYARTKWNFLSWLREGIDNPDWVFERLWENYSSPVRDRLILSFFINNDFLPNNMQAAYTIAQRTLEDPYCKTALEKLRFRLQDMPAYDFSLPDSAGRIFHLSDFKGKPVLLDVWFTGCGACASIYQSFLQELEATDSIKGKVTFLTVSLDQDKARWYQGLSSGLYTGKNAINLFTEGMGISHPFISQYEINTFPTLILLDANGKIVQYNSANLYNKDVVPSLITQLVETNK